ncbi:uncharacterized protein PHACADRAFT_143061 [Phanerochaete carnosa HHB-10118-sp]|uniref:Uncharacterized protein n=1 Tax=Phanerochaete carnosa (strain HHB-10118-sp) TaxID=650164 RepID=K5VUB7_PHACS|nr:uncharacterized protein PHACADRAFT_143061 [Phanerochaete carnosa HHB-10118-sp]EKM55118.1 hypothetical protein PHACADRAFT_143061 [Phanerochaete carnosa HHB-10118-sp]
MSDLQIGEDHPLSLELASLRATVASYQHEAHAAAVKLQRHSLDTSRSLEQTNTLRQENARLREEIAVLKAHPDVAPHPAALQVQELTLALRRLSEKLTSTEDILLLRTTELTHARSDLHTAQLDSEAAHTLTVQAYIQIDHERQKQRELERRIRSAEEERRLADLVVQEYADLVRNLEGRNTKVSPSPLPLATRGSATDSSTTLINGLAEGKLGLHKLLVEHHAETEKLAAHATKLSDENEFLKTQLDVERKRSEADRESLAKLLLELDKCRLDDSTATKMVSRYMKFSQSTIDSLQQAMENTKTRHAATLATFNVQADHLQKALSAERRQAEKLRNTLDELSEDINREAYGRRREVALRLAFLSREESLAENLRRWLHRSRESMDRSLAGIPEQESRIRDASDRLLRDAESLLDSLNGQPNVDDSPASVARLVAAQDAVRCMAKELHEETEKRLQLQCQLAEPNDTAPILSDVALSLQETVISVSVLTLPKPPAEPSEPSALLFGPAHNPPLVATPSAGNKQALLEELSKVKFRYQELQKSFRDCNVTLKDLKKDAGSLSPTFDMSGVIRTAIDRLDDYNEDARVELEIQVADEERILIGYETLLSVAGALDEDMEESKLQEDIRAFIDGSNRAVTRAMTQFPRKLDDLQHDIASIKKALHEISTDADDAARPTTPPKHGAGWSSWTAGILGSGGASRPVSPAPSFGAVMTSPRQRQSSFSFTRRPSTLLDARSRSPSDDGPDPFASLGLRIPMPVHAMPTPALPKTGTFLSPMSMGTPLRPGPKPRASSASLFSLGLGARSSTFSFVAQSPRSPSKSALWKEEGSKDANPGRESLEESSSDIE